MNFSLISAFSSKVSWEEIVDTSVYTVQWKHGDETMETKVEKTNIVLVNLKPETNYYVNIISDGKVLHSADFETFPESTPQLHNLYESIKTDDGGYDATQFEKQLHDVFLKFFNNVVKSGDKIYTPVTIKGVKRNIETTAVVKDTVMNVDGDQNLFLPFSQESGKNQKVTLQNAVGSLSNTRVDVRYNDKNDSFTLGKSVYKVGDKFELFGKTVTVGEGSIVLVFEDTVALVYPFDITTASNVVTTLGSQFAKNLTCNVINAIGTTTTGVAGSTYQSAWMYDSTLDTIAETTRIVHTMDSAGENATISIGVLHTDGNSNRFIEPVIQASPDATVISTQDASDNVASATFASTGLSFDTQDAAIYLGSTQQFRIICIDGTPSTLSIQSYDSGSGTYVTRSEFSDST